MSIFVKNEEIVARVEEHFPFNEFREYQKQAICKIIKAFKDYKYVVVEAPAGSGKAQPLYSKIKVPGGWVKMENIKVGQEVCTPDGKIAKVLRISQKNIKDVYRIVFEDGRSTDCCKDHLWKVFNRDLRKWKIFTTEQLIQEKSKHSMQIPLPIIFNESQDLPLDPYILGLFLKKTKDHLDKTDQNLYKEALEDLTLSNIPKIYLESSVKQRTELLRGLINIENTLQGRALYSTNSCLLALDVQYLVRSLGGLCTIKTKKGIKKQCIIKYDPEIFRKFDEKKERVVPSPTALKCSFKSIKLVGQITCQCISIDHPNQLYITDNFIATHNSPISYTLAKILESEDKKSYFIVPYKILQDQYLRDFKDMALIKGLSNYKCANGSWCNEAECRIPSVNKKLQRAHTQICPYQKAKRYAAASSLTLFNTAAYLTHRNHTTFFENRELTVIDEAHVIENVLMSFISIEFHQDYLKKLLPEIEIPSYDLPSAYLDWVLSVKNLLKNLIEEEYSYLQEQADLQGCSVRSLMSEEQVKQFTLIQNYLERCFKYLEIDQEKIDEHFVVSFYEFAKKKSIEFKPIKIDCYAEKYLFQHGEHHLFLSATIFIDDFCKSLGLKREDVKFFKIPSTFPEPKKRRPFIVDNVVGALSRKVLDTKLPLLAKRIEEIATNYKKHKGIIHTHTYKITEYILKNASPELLDRIITHKGGTVESGLTREEALYSHIKAEGPTILMSPMMYEGVDLKGDLARWNVICKVPFSSLGDPQVKRRLEIDPDWYQWQTILKIQQAYGRTTRSKVDWSYTIILDRAFLYLYDRNSFMFSKWFDEAILVKAEL